MAHHGLRVIAGTARGLHLAVPVHARPTSDRVRESVFGSLGAVFDGASVADLYAGSGALAIEALSRGAARAVLVEQDPGAATVCKRNLVTARMAERARVQRSSVAVFLHGRPPAEAPFDLVFCDPPYATGNQEVERALEALGAPGWLAADALVVVERARSAPGLECPPGWRSVRERSYGDTLVAFLSLVDERRDGGGTAQTPDLSAHEER
jgi:16S rRNA (guanine966-N2)-methyltransferase